MSQETLARFSDQAFVAVMAVEVLALIAWATVVAQGVYRVRRAESDRARRLAGQELVPATSSRRTRTESEGASAEHVDGGPVAEPAFASQPRSTRIAIAISMVATALLTAAVAARGLAAGRPPWGNMFEFVTTGALGVAVVFLVMVTRRPVQAAGPWVTALVLAAIGLAMTALYTPVSGLVPVLDSYWLVVHVAAAIISGAIFTVAAFTALLTFLRARVDAERAMPMLRGYARSLPRAESLDRVTHGAIVLAFPIWTFAVIAGAIWAEDAWGRYWGWDPKETWAFITWVMYAAYLHAQSTAGWRGARANWFAIAGYAAFVFNFFGVNLWISGLHSYAGV